MTQDFSGLSIYYDTSVLLRLLGTSGRTLRTATYEMHNALQSLGCKVQFFQHTELEVLNILQSIIHSHDHGVALFGETAEAILNGEIGIAAIKDLAATFVERLSQAGIFESKYSYENTSSANFHQMDETKFGNRLRSVALGKNRLYSQHNVENDARTLALILRLRRGHGSRDVSDCRQLFITTNRLLASVARAFYVDEEGGSWQHVPPILTTGQISTVAWLAKTKDLAEDKVSKELLANCYSAVRPDEDWTPKFLETLENFKQENPEAAAKYAELAVFLQSARRIAQDSSFANAVVFQRLKPIDIFTRAIEAANETERKQRENLDQREQAIRNEAKQEAQEAAKLENQSRMFARADRWALRVIFSLRIILLALFVISLFWDRGVFATDRKVTAMLLQALLLIFAIISGADRVGLPVKISPVPWIQERLRRVFLRLFQDDA